MEPLEPRKRQATADRFPLVREVQLALRWQLLRAAERHFVESTIVSETNNGYRLAFLSTIASSVTPVVAVQAIATTSEDNAMIYFHHNTFVLNLNAMFGSADTRPVVVSYDAWHMITDTVALCRVLKSKSAPVKPHSRTLIFCEETEHGLTSLADVLRTNPTLVRDNGDTVVNWIRMTVATVAMLAQKGITHRHLFAQSVYLRKLHPGVNGLSYADGTVRVDRAHCSEYQAVIGDFTGYSRATGPAFQLMAPDELYTHTEQGKWAHEQQPTEQLDILSPNPGFDCATLALSFVSFFATLQERPSESVIRAILALLPDESILLATIAENPGFRDGNRRLHTASCFVRLRRDLQSPADPATPDTWNKQLAALMTAMTYFIPQFRPSFFTTPDAALSELERILPSPAPVADRLFRRIAFSQ